MSDEQNREIRKVKYGVRTVRSYEIDIDIPSERQLRQQRVEQLIRYDRARMAALGLYSSLMPSRMKTFSGFRATTGPKVFRILAVVLLTAPLLTTSLNMPMCFQPAVWLPPKKTVLASAGLAHNTSAAEMTAARNQNETIAPLFARIDFSPRAKSNTGQQVARPEPIEKSLGDATSRFHGTLRRTCLIAIEICFLLRQAVPTPLSKRQTHRVRPSSAQDEGRGWAIKQYAQ